MIGGGNGEGGRIRKVQKTKFRKMHDSPEQVNRYKPKHSDKSMYRMLKKEKVDYDDS